MLKLMKRKDGTLISITGLLGNLGGARSILDQNICWVWGVTAFRGDLGF